MWQKYPTFISLSLIFYTPPPSNNYINNLPTTPLVSKIESNIHTVTNYWVTFLPLVPVLHIYA